MAAQNNTRLRPIQPKEGEILEVIGECANMKVVRRDGALWALKFFYTNGAILYVPFPQSDGPNDDEVRFDISVGPMTA
jgi:hypothetical protein